MASRENQLQQAKLLVRALFDELEARNGKPCVEVLSRHLSADFHWRGLHPFHEQRGVEAVADVFWNPLCQSFKSLSRREDIFLAGFNNAGEQDLNADVVDTEDIWVASMGHFFGLFDEPWLDIPATRKLGSLRYAEFYRVVNGKIVEGSMFFDLLALMQQAGCYPLAPETGHSFMYPGPKTHQSCSHAAGLKTCSGMVLQESVLPTPLNVISNNTNTHSEPDLAIKPLTGMSAESPRAITAVSLVGLI